MILIYPKNLILTIFEFKYLSLFGKYTFCLYITHIPIYRVLQKCIIGPYKLYYYGIIIYIFGIIIALIISVIFYNLIEIPSRKYFVNPIITLFEKQSLWT